MARQIGQTAAMTSKEHCISYRMSGKMMCMLCCATCALALVKGCHGAAELPRVKFGSLAAASDSRPEWTKYSKMARWLVHTNNYGTLSTISRSLTPKGGPPVPFGNVVSFSDGPRGESPGRLLFYLTALDASAYELQASATLAR